MHLVKLKASVVYSSSYAVNACKSGVFLKIDHKTAVGESQGAAICGGVNRKAMSRVSALIAGVLTGGAAYAG